MSLLLLFIPPTMGFTTKLGLGATTSAQPTNALVMGFTTKLGLGTNSAQSAYATMMGFTTKIGLGVTSAKPTYALTMASRLMTGLQNTYNMRVVVTPSATSKLWAQTVSRPQLLQQFAATSQTALRFTSTPRLVVSMSSVSQPSLRFAGTPRLAVSMSSVSQHLLQTLWESPSLRVAFGVRNKLQFDSSVRIQQFPLPAFTLSIAETTSELQLIMTNPSFTVSCTSED